MLSPEALAALLDGAELGLCLRGGDVSSTSQLHCSPCQSQPVYGRQSTVTTVRTTNPEELAQRRIVWLARLALDIFLHMGVSGHIARQRHNRRAYQVFGEPEPQCAQHAPQGLVRIADADEGLGSVEIVPVLCDARQEARSDCYRRRGT